jgi:beta-lactamase superfamily II metal-dependent hydrolase
MDGTLMRMKQLILLILLAAATADFRLNALGVPSPSLPAPAGTSLDIYIADTEGGKAALFVAPSGQTVLVDSGFPGARDTDRITAMLADAGVKKIDYMISTHYHLDHIGGLQELAKRFPIGTYVDHGATLEAREQVAGFQAAYAELYAAAKHLVVKAGDRLPITGVDWRIVTSAGEAIKKPLPGGGAANPACAGFHKREEPATPDDNNASVGSVIAYGRFRLIDLADLLWNKEGELMCPMNPIGTVDIYMADNHGSPSAGSAALVHGVRPRVAIMQNGTRKGASVQAFEILETSRGLEDIWQLHWSYGAGIEHNAPGVFIANVDDAATIANVLTAAPGGRGGGNAAAAHTPAYYLKISAQSDGTFSITNTRSLFNKTYPPRENRSLPNR